MEKHKWRIQKLEMYVTVIPTASPTKIKLYSDCLPVQAVIRYLR